MPATESKPTAGSVDATLSETGYRLKITRTFDAPRELVWKAWTDPKMAMHWRGPRGFQVTEYTAPRGPGSGWNMSMEGYVPGTKQMARLQQGGRTLEFVPPEKLVYTFAWDDRASVGLGPSPFKESIITVLFEDHGAKTVMHFLQAPFATESERDGHTGGWNSAFDRFAEFMLEQPTARNPDPAGMPTELHLRHFVPASRQAVFDAWTKPEQLAKWWGPKGFTNPRCEADARSGGAIRIDMLAPDGTIYPMTGKFVEVHPPNRFHFTTTPLNKDGVPLFELWNSVFLEEVAGGTEVVLDVHVMTMTDQAPQYIKGMTMGWNQSLDRLTELFTIATAR